MRLKWKEDKEKKYMSDDFVQKLTLNCLISQHQLYKLNKTMKKNANEKRKSQLETYRKQIEELFQQLMSGNAPDNLMLEVQNSFDIFVDKSVYYLQALERSKEEPECDIQDDIDYDKEEQMIANGGVMEEEEGDEEDESEIH